MSYCGKGCESFLFSFFFFCSLGKTKVNLDMSEINLEINMKLTMTYERQTMNILYVVFVNEKPV